MEELSSGQVVLATFPFSNLESSKVRPYLLLGIAEFEDVVLCQITSRRYRSKSAISLTNDDFSSGSIIVSSFIRPNKLATLNKSKVRRVLGIVSDSKMSEVKLNLKNFLDIS